MSILRARIEQQERRIERLRCLIDKAEAIRDGLREREIVEARTAYQKWIEQRVGAVYAQFGGGRKA